MPISYVAVPANCISKTNEIRHNQSNIFYLSLKSLAPSQFISFPILDLLVLKDIPINGLAGNSSHVNNSYNYKIK